MGAAEAALAVAVAAVAAAWLAMLLRLQRRVHDLEARLDYERMRINDTQRDFWRVSQEVRDLGGECGFIRTEEVRSAPRWERKL